MRRARLARFHSYALAAAIAGSVAAGCSSRPTTRELAHDMVDAMGGAERLGHVRSVAMMHGDGSRWQLGQSVKTSDPDSSGTLNAVTETVDLTDRRAALDYEISTNDGFTQRRQEVLTASNGRSVGLERVGGRPPAILSPEALFSMGPTTPALALRRNIITIALAALSADATQLAEDRDLDGRRVRFGRTVLHDESIGIYFDRGSKLIAAFEALDTDPIRGDVTARYILDDYRRVNGIMLPFRTTIIKDGARYATVHFTTASVDDPALLGIFDLPSDAGDSLAAVAANRDYSPLTLTPIADGVSFAQGLSHHSLVVEFPTYLAVVEAPYSEAQSQMLLQMLAAQFPAKPVRYVVVTHPHFDHIGGVRAMAASGATIVVAAAHEPVLRALLAARHTNPADDLEIKRKTGARVGTLQSFTGSTTALTEGTQSLELHVVTGSPHAEPIVIADVPSARVLFQSDLYFPGTGATVTPASRHLLQTIRALNLNVDTIAGGHGGVGPFAELVAVVSGSTPPPAPSPTATLSMRH